MNEIHDEILLSNMSYEDSPFGNYHKLVYDKKFRMSCFCKGATRKKVRHDSQIKFAEYRVFMGEK